MARKSTSKKKSGAKALAAARGRQSAVLPYRRGPGGVEVLLVSSRKGKRWVPPKGNIEPSLTTTALAAKEAFEEAGVEGMVAYRGLGSYRYRKKGAECTVDVFPMEVTFEHSDWPEADQRNKAWMNVAEAANRVDEGELAHLLLSLPVWIRKCPNPVVSLHGLRRRANGSADRAVVRPALWRPSKGLS